MRDTGPCWSCDAPNSTRYECERGHVWFCCEETCGQKVGHASWPGGESIPMVDWDNCHECQAQADHDEKEFAARLPVRR